jgi:hypothetical protein
MGAGQRIKGTMIKGTWPPAGVCCVARGTICGEFSCHVVRIFRSLIGGIVTAITIFRGIAKLAVEVTGGAIACDGRVSARQWIDRIMVKGAWSPAWIG